MAGVWVFGRDIGLRGDEICAICAYRTEYFVIKCLFLRFYASSEACLYLVSFCMTAFDDLFSCICFLSSVRLFVWSPKIIKKLSVCSHVDSSDREQVIVIPFAHMIDKSRFNLLFYDVTTVSSRLLTTDYFSSLPTMSTEYDTPKTEPTTPLPYSLQQPSRVSKQFGCHVRYF